MNPLFLLLGFFGASLSHKFGTSSNTSSKGGSKNFETDLSSDNDDDTSEASGGGITFGGDTTAEDTTTEDTAGDDTGGHTSGGDTSGGDTTAEDTATEDTAGDDTGGHTSGGDTSGGDTTAEDTATEDTAGDDTGGHTSGGDTSGGTHDNHNSNPDIPPPGRDASAAEINAYVEALSAADEMHIHDATSSKAGEHDATMNLVARGEATHIAIDSGDWSDPGIWANGEVPGDNAKVLIPDGVSVDYSTVSDASLFTVRVDGNLEFATDTNSQMIFDTFVVSPSGHVTIGTTDDPVDPNVTVDLIIADNGPIDTSWDPFMLSRGFVSHGDVTIHGDVKDSHDKVTDDPMTGDSSVKFTETPEGWQVGDTIVIAGTHYDGYKHDQSTGTKGYFEPEDEERVITKIDDDGTIWFKDPLEHDHDTPRDDLFTSVANYTRNVSFETENADDVDVAERGHVMFMHSDDVDVRYAEFHELGRTDKSEDSFDISDIDNVQSDSNVQGRYSLHLHRTGISDLENPTILEGNAVYGSPGWGIVHHDSNALITNNATYDTFGAGMVAETGNETGAWVDNIVIYAQGQSWSIPKDSTELESFDTGRGGDGFWFQGRMVASVDNVAASVNTGFVYFHRDGDDRMIDFDASLFTYSEALYYNTDVTADDAPILIAQGNETFAAKEGMHVVKASPAQGHDVWSHIDDFTAWSVKSGVHMEYSSHYILTDFDLIGKEATPFSEAGTGIFFGNNLTEIVLVDPKVSGFEEGIDLNKSWSGNLSGSSDSLKNFVVIDPVITNVDQAIANYNSNLDLVTSRDDLQGFDPNLELNKLIFKDGVVQVSGTKFDSIGKVDFPGGTDDFDLDMFDAVRVMEEKGFWTTSDGEKYFLMDVYFTDRLTGEIYYETQPVYVSSQHNIASPTVADGLFANIEQNGVQDITSQNGILMAGNQTLDTAIAVTLPTVDMSPLQSAPMSHTTTHSATAHETWLAGYDGADPLGVTVTDGLFVNDGDMSNTDVTAKGGTTVLATDGGEYDVGASRTLAIFEAAAKVGFDGEDGGTAILDLHEGATVSFVADDEGLGTIEEFHSGAFSSESPNVLSGIDLGNATLSINLSGLSAEAGTAFTLMDVDEIKGIFNEAIVDGLGTRDAKILIDYKTDAVSLELSPGEGGISIETLGEETEVDSSEDLWLALTADHVVLDDTAANDMHDDMEDDLVAAA